MVAAAAVAVLSALPLSLPADVAGLHPTVLLIRPIAIAASRGIASLHRDSSHRRLRSLHHSQLLELSHQAAPVEVACLDVRH